jgi:hypothetical protein
MKNLQLSYSISIRCSFKDKKHGDDSGHWVPRRRVSHLLGMTARLLACPHRVIADPRVLQWYSTWDAETAAMMRRNGTLGDAGLGPAAGVIRVLRSHVPLTAPLQRRFVLVSGPHVEDISSEDEYADPEFDDIIMNFVENAQDPSGHGGGIGNMEL